jgi:phosphate transport system permease protein
MKKDKRFKKFLSLGGIVIVLLFLGILLALLVGSWDAIERFGLHFLTSKDWDPVQEKFGLLPFLAGSLFTSILALIISTPFSIALAIILGFYFKKGFIYDLLSFFSDLLAAIPSVIYGLWGLFFLVPIVRKMEISMGVMPYGVGILTASIILAIMIIPYAASIARETIAMVPDEIIEGAYALGATDLDVNTKIVLPYAKSGIIAGILLSFGRAFGETMTVTMLIGNTNIIPTSIFSTGNTMASVIANEFTEASKNIHLSSLIYIGLWLLIFTLLINYIGVRIVEKYEVKKNA